MEDQPEMIRKQMEDTRSSLSDKLEALEQKVADKVEPVADAVERTTEAVAETAETVKETVQAVTGQVKETMHSMASALDIRRHTEKHPWIVFGVAATVGCLAGSILGRRAQRRQVVSSAQPRSRHNGRGGDGAAHHPEWGVAKRSRGAGKPQTETLFSQELRQLKGLAISSLLGFVRDLARRAVPGAIGEKIAEELDGFTTRLGAQPLKSPVIDMEKDQSSEEGRSTAKTSFGPEAHRMRAGGREPGLS
jgi:ElaB/YqjD/DUF883 family membrane-anchored ribosome-binding protein